MCLLSRRRAHHGLTASAPRPMTLWPLYLARPADDIRRKHAPARTGDSACPCGFDIRWLPIGLATDPYWPCLRRNRACCRWPTTYEGQAARLHGQPAEAGHWWS